MRAEDLKGWLAAARRGEKEREARIKDRGDGEGEQEAQTEAEGHWGRVMEIVQTAFWEGEMDPPRETPSRSQSHLLQWRMASPRRRKWSGR